jgi:hypothetical protein
MWRPSPTAAGADAVSLKAALDVGGGDRFDLGQNCLLGGLTCADVPALRQPADALAAYNWGPGNVDGWIADGRRGRLPSETFRYVLRCCAMR